MRKTASAVLLLCLLLVPAVGHGGGGVLIRGWALDEETALPLGDAVIELAVDEGGLGYHVYTGPDGSFEVRSDAPQEGAGYWPAKVFGERIRDRESLTVYGVRASGWRNGYRYVLSRSTLPPPASGSMVRPLAVDVYLRRVEPLRRLKVVTNAPQTPFTLTVFGTVGRRDGAGILHVLPAAYVLPVVTNELGIVDVDLAVAFPHERVYGGLSLYNRGYVLVDYPQALEEAGAGETAGFLGLRFTLRRAGERDWGQVAAATGAWRELMAMAADGVLLQSLRPRFSGGHAQAYPLPDFGSPITRAEFFDLALRAMRFDLQVIPGAACVLVGEEAEAVSNLNYPYPLIGEAARRGFIRGKSAAATVPPGTTYLTRGASVDLELADEVTRAEAAAFLLRLKGLAVEEELPNPFGDLPQTHWARHAILTAYKHGVVYGYGQAKFGPDDFLTVEQAVFMVYRLFYGGH